MTSSKDADFEHQNLRLATALYASAMKLFIVGAAVAVPTMESYAQLAGGGLGTSGYAVGGSSLRDTVSSLQSGPSPLTSLPWTFSGDVDVEVGATDSPGGVGRSSWQPVILLAPDLILNGVTSRLNVALVYSPRLAIYPSTSGQTLFSQSFNGSVGATLVPDLLFLNARGISELSSRFGNTSAFSNSFVSRNEAVQTTSLSVSPYLQRTFGGNGTLTVGYSYAQTFQDSASGSTPYFAPNAAQTAGFGTTGNLQTNTEFASYTTGENLGRIQNSVSATASQYSGSYFYQGASTSAVSDRLSYVVYRWLTVFGTVGYENYNYPRSGYKLSEPTWTVGVTLTPNETSSLTVQYGQIAGGNTVLANGIYSPTARTRIFGSYTVDIETGLGARQALLASTSVGPGGILLNNLTGSPTVANSYLASQSPLSRVKTATVGGSLLLDRDTVTATVAHSELEQLGGGSVSILGVTTQAGTTTSTTYGTLNWQHDLNPSTSLSSGISYATSDNGVYYGSPGSSQDTLQVYSSLNHVFTDTLSGSVSYSHAQRFGTAARNLPAAFGGPASQNTLLVGLRKSF